MKLCKRKLRTAFCLVICTSAVALASRATPVSVAAGFTMAIIAGLAGCKPLK